MAQVIEPTNDAGHMVANRIEPVLASPGASIYGQQKLTTVLDFFQYRFSDSFGGNSPPTGVMNSCYGTVALTNK